DCGLNIGLRGGILVDKTLRTSDNSIYAAGDAVETVNFISKERAVMPLAGPANKMGRMVADNICGLNRKYSGTQGSMVAKVFDLTVAATGSGESQLKSAGMKLGADYKVTILHPLSNAGYYPGGMTLTIKLIFGARDGRVLGAQAAGYKGVEKRIDVIAAAIRFGATVYDLEELELCYAPPYSTAKDPVNLAGYSADNLLSGLVDNITFGELDGIHAAYLDVRTAAEYDMGAIPDSINIPVDSIRESLDKLDKDKTYIIYCAVGIRSYIAARILKQNGFDKVFNLAGGYTTYRVASGDYTIDGGGGSAVESETRINTELRGKTIHIDACGLMCPGPVMKLYGAIKEARDGDIINIISTDPGFFADAASWCSRTKNTYIKGEAIENGFSVWIKKGGETTPANAYVPAAGNDKSIIVFSGDLDRALASFIIANGAAAMGRKVTMFFTFWGLNVLRRHGKVKTNKNLIEKMFGAMMPRGAQKLKLSKMNMLGLGSSIMRGIMKKKNIDSLDALIALALKNGVALVACTMSMDVMGIKREELIDGVAFAGVASYLGAAETADTNLFI
ncbi:MAG: DsrE/DsrF/DrsH-like family protein, partial [Christensenellales bacterium]